MKSSGDTKTGMQHKMICPWQRATLHVIQMRSLHLISKGVLALCVVLALPASASAGNTYMTVADAHRALASHLPTIRKEMSVKRAWVDHCERSDEFNVLCHVVVPVEPNAMGIDQEWTA